MIYTRRLLWGVFFPSIVIGILGGGISACSGAVTKSSNCGNDNCERDETCTTCPEDCGSCGMSGKGGSEGQDSSPGDQDSSPGNQVSSPGNQDSSPGDQDGSIGTSDSNNDAEVCRFFSASWEANTVKEGTEARLTVEAANCSCSDIVIELWEADGSEKQAPSVEPKVSCDNGSVGATWIAEHNDEDDSSEWYISVGLSGEPNTVIESGQLTVLGLDAVTQCNDGVDNDGDGLVDWQYDLGCNSVHDLEESALSRDQENGWTTFDPSSDSIIVYVSSSSGDDSRDGLSPETSVKSISRGVELVRDGYPDFLLLKRGDVWRDEYLGRFKSGRGQDAPLLVATYGESSERPRLEVAANLIDHDGQSRSYVAIVGVEVVSYPKRVGDSSFDGATGGGIRYVGGGNGLLVEDCRFVHGEIVVQSYDENTYEHVEIRRNVIERNYHIGTCNQSPTYRPSGMYFSHGHDVLIEENLFDHNGWNEEVSDACASMYNHNLYLNSNDMTVRNNLILRASSANIKMRSDSTGDCDGVVIENNLFVEGEIGISFGGNTEEPYRFSNAVVRDNVFFAIGRSNPTGRDFSWNLDIADHDNLLIENNAFMNQPWYDNAYGVLLGGGSARNIHLNENIFYRLRRRGLSVKIHPNWDSVTVTQNVYIDPDLDSCLVDHEGAFDIITYQGNRYYSAGSPAEWFCVDGLRQSFEAWKTASGEADANDANLGVSDSSRSVATYGASLGFGNSFEAFIQQAAQQSRYNWRPELTAAAVNDYLRSGLTQ